MNNIDIIRAWKDEDYRLELNLSEIEALPANPAGMVELSDDQMGRVVGGLVAAITYGGICDTYTDGCPKITDPCTVTVGCPSKFGIKVSNRW
jgi:mersacidin/lichenicidin family type 2 lantibiotic